MTQMEVLRNRKQNVGELLRDWRKRRKLSQFDFACEVDISAKHLSFVETGRAQPSRDMVLHLAEGLSVPLRERNALLVAAGYAPHFPERPLGSEALAAAKEAVDIVLKGHEPYPALAIDRHWNMVASNKSVAPLLAGADSDLLEDPVNVLRLSLHPRGLAPGIVNLSQCREHLLGRLRRQIDATGDSTLKQLLAELLGYPCPIGSAGLGKLEYGGFVVPMTLSTPNGPMHLFSTTTVFGSPADVTLSEIAIESFFPADTASGEILRGLVSPENEM